MYIMLNFIHETINNSDDHKFVILTIEFLNFV